MDWNRIKQYLFNQTPKPRDTKSFPLTNELSPVIPINYGKPPEVDYNLLWAYFKASPELQAILTAIADDIVSDGWVLEGGRNNRKRATKFLLDNHAKQTFYSVLVDILLTGDGYIWKDKINPQEFKNSLKKVIARKGLEYKGMDYIMKATEEDLFSTRTFIDVASSTMKININKYGDVINYVQKPLHATETETFTTDQIIHFRLMKLNGKTYGYSPSQSLLTIMDILEDIRDYARYYFRKGGVPNYLFILKNATTTDPDYKEMNKAIQEYNNITHKYKNLLLTGEVDVKELNKMDHDMEFRELARYLTQLMVMIWSIPSSRLSDMLISNGVKGSNTSTEGYYRKISHIQDIFEEMINEQLLNEFDVMLKFNRTYKQDEVRETQIEMMRADTLLKNQSLLANYKLRLTKRKLLHYLKLEEDDVETHEVEPMPNDTNRQDQLNNHQMLTDNEDKLADDKVKQKENTGVKSYPFSKFKKTYKKAE